MTNHPSSLTVGMTAHHETGHAITAIMLHRPFEAIEIFADGSGEFIPKDPRLLMDCETYLQVGTKERAEVEAQIPVYMGGIEAQRRYLVDAGCDGLELGRRMQTCSYDLDAARNMATGMTATPAEADAYLDWLRLRAVGLWSLLGFWNDVKIVAAALQEHGRLTECECWHSSQPLRSPNGQRRQMLVCTALTAARRTARSALGRRGLTTSESMC